MRIRNHEYLVVAALAASGFACGEVDSGSSARVLLGEHTVALPAELKFDALHPFALSLDPTSRDVTLTAADMSDSPPRLIGNVIEQTSCRPGGPTSDGLAKLARLGHSKVRSLTVQFVYEPTVDGRPSVQDPSSACFGVRGTDGSWTWSSQRVAIAFDPSAQRLRVTFELPDAPVDAIKVIGTGAKLYERPVERVTFDVVAGP